MSKNLMDMTFDIKCHFLHHLTQIYCLTFDRSGLFVITGGDEGIVNIYSLRKKALIQSLCDESETPFVEEVEKICKMDFKCEDNGSIDEQMERFAVCDLAVNYENTLVAAAKHNGSILVWNLKTYELVVKLDEQVFPIRSISFSQAVFGQKKYLISTSNDGFILFFAYNRNTLEFDPKSLHRKSKYDGERATNICCDCTSGGLLVGVNHTFGVKQITGPKSKKTQPTGHRSVQSAIRIFSLNDESGPKEEWKTTYSKSHSECEYSMRFSHKSFRFATGCDGDSNAFIWSFDKSNKKWESIIIDINTKENKQILRGKTKPKNDCLFVDELIFTCDDNHLITNLSNNSIKVWNSETGELVQHFDKYHINKISVIECHPIHDHIFMTAGYDSNIYIYDILNGSVLKHFNCILSSKHISENFVIDDNEIDSIYPMLLQCSFSPNGQTIAATDNFGNLYTFSSNSPKEPNLLDQLEEQLEKIHTESESEDDISLPVIMSSDTKFIESIFQFECDLLKGIEKPSPTKSNQSFEERKVTTKSVNKIDSENGSQIAVGVKKTPVSVTKRKKVKKISPVKKLTVPKKAIIDSVDKEIKTVEKTPLKKSTVPKMQTRQSITELIDNSESKPIESSTVPKIETIETINDFTDNSETIAEKKSLNATKSNRKTNPRQNYISIMDKIIADPMSGPFQTINHLLYPDYRKQISDPDICLNSILVDLKIGHRFTQNSFNKAMNTVFENFKKFFRHKDKSIYKMTIDLQKVYCNEMKAHFGDNFKPPLNLDDEECDESVAKESSFSMTKSNGIENMSTSTPKQKTLKRKSTTNSKSVAKRIKSYENTSLDSTESVEREDISVENIEENSSSKSNDCKQQTVETDSIHLKVYETVEEEDDTEVVVPALKPTIDITKDVNESQIINTCDNQMQTSDQKKSLFCLFCDKIFLTKSEATLHYIIHLCPLKCCHCKQSFSGFDEYLGHSCSHPKTSENIEWCRYYSDSIIWIEKFLHFQTSDDIELFELPSSQSKNCIVCDKVQQLRPESQKKIKDIKWNCFESHLKEHFKYVPQYQCLICFLNEDKYFYCKNSVEASQHVSKEHLTYESDVSKVLQYFDPSIPMLDQLFRSFIH